MKHKALPAYIDDIYVNNVVEDCVRFLQGTAPWWIRHSCLNCREAKQLINIFMVTFSTWRKRQAQPNHKRSIGPNNLYDLGPFIYELSYTINQLANQDSEHLNNDLKKLLTAICQDSQDFLKNWHNLNIEQHSDLPLPKVI
ncbi:hypothetical protein ACVFI8_07925 [Agarivorans sp. MS3-6]